MLNKTNTQSSVLGKGKRENLKQEESERGPVLRGESDDAGKTGGIVAFGKRQVVRSEGWMRLKEGSTEIVPQI